MYRVGPRLRRLARRLANRYPTVLAALCIAGCVGAALLGLVSVTRDAATAERRMRSSGRGPAARCSSCALGSGRPLRGGGAVFTRARLQAGDEHRTKLERSIALTVSHYRAPSPGCAADPQDLEFVPQPRIFGPFQHGDSSALQDERGMYWSGVDRKGDLSLQAYFVHNIPELPRIRLKGTLQPRLSFHEGQTSLDSFVANWKIVHYPNGLNQSGRNRIRNGIQLSLMSPKSVVGMLLQPRPRKRPMRWVSEDGRERETSKANSVIPDIHLDDTIEYKFFPDSGSSFTRGESDGRLSPKASPTRMKFQWCFLKSDHGMEPELPDGFFSGLTIWNSDLHAGPIKCLLDQFVQYGITVKAQIDFWHCGFFGMCKTDLKVFSFDDWRGFGLEPCPYSLRRKFFAAYKKDEEFAKVDAFICSHPVANCELFLPFNRTVILYLTTRLEFGRHDSVVFWRQQYADSRAPARWKEWIHNLQVLASKTRKHIIVANNPFDVEYARYHSGLDVAFIPSFCGHAGNVQYLPSRPELLIGPSRDNLARGDWGDRRKHPLVAELFEASKMRAETTASTYHFAFMTEVYPAGYHFQDLARHKLIVCIPYQTSLMSFVEFYRMNVPLFFPSLALLMKWELTYEMTWERVYGYPEELVLPHTPYSPNSHECADETVWLSLADFYQWPHVQFFNSWEHLLELIDSADLSAISSSMRMHNACMERTIKARWGRALQKVFPSGFAGRVRQTHTDIDSALAQEGFHALGTDVRIECQVESASAML